MENKNKIRKDYRRRDIRRSIRRGINKGGLLAIIFTIFILASLFILSSCEGNKKLKYDYRTGTDGLILEFIRNAPPDRIYEGQDFTIGVLVKNKGAYDVKDAILSLAVERDYIKLKEDSIKSINVKGKSMYNMRGEEEAYFYEATSGMLESMSQYHYSDIFASVCYEYRTYLLDDVCIDTDPLNVKVGAKFCTAQIKTYSGQGAPVAITRIEPEFLPRGDKVRPVFTIYIKNVGNGKVFNLDEKRNVCTAAKVPSDVYGVFEMTILLGKDEMECSPKNFRLIEGEDYIKCTLPTEHPGYDSKSINFVTPLSIELLYGYTTIENIKVNIENIDR